MQRLGFNVWSVNTVMFSNHTFRGRETRQGVSGRCISEMNRLFRSTKLLEIGAGTTEVRKMIIAGELLSDQ
ncbi:hypothetical protein [Endozoicomonas euniceicola]|uniref:Acyl-CoA dehydrogenase/oxidase C-terminal domain-containing protein n=1 Tax=Endozoicomonas euniceicola TaxID=1234143 RepID=A0ABY6H0E7_9GAMM|nr:hypothetical protein [Endozoicomonas euniceicola]UYM17761.1 hypothetical protein NX720_07590 [Endozoicomonas euniceicola]